MAWIRVESSVARNRKFVKAGPGPSWLWLCGLAYCQEGLTDGFIPTEAIDFLGVKSARHMVKHLVSAGLWDAIDGGWQVHDYLDHNKPASEVRRIIADRRDAGANGGRARRSKTDELASTVAKQTAKPSTALLCTALPCSDQQQSVRAEPPSDSTPVIVTFPTVGKHHEWHLREGQIARWRDAYPNLDVTAEARRAGEWIAANPERRKTAKGMPAFLVNWFNRTVDRGGARGGAPPSPKPMSDAAAVVFRTLGAKP